jgi:hypothetical protein
MVHVEYLIAAWSLQRSRDGLALAIGASSRRGPRADDFAVPRFGPPPFLQ